MTEQEVIDNTTEQPCAHDKVQISIGEDAWREKTETYERTEDGVKRIGDYGKWESQDDPPDNPQWVTQIECATCGIMLVEDNDDSDEVPEGTIEYWREIARDKAMDSRSDD